MVRKTSTVYLFFTMLLVMFSIVTNVSAATQRIYDKAGLFSDSQRAALEQNAVELSGKLNLDIIIVTTNDVEGKTSREYADDFYDNNGFGYGENKDGILLLINMENREVYISTSGKGIQYFTDTRINSMLDNIYVYLKDGKYGDGAAAFLNEVEKYVQMGVPSNQYSQDENTGTRYTPDGKVVTQTGRERDTVKMILIYLGISFAAGGIAVGVMALNNRGTSTINQNTYLDKNSFNIVNSQDNLYDTRVTFEIIENNSGSSGKSSTHSSSSGRSHGGGGRGF